MQFFIVFVVYICTLSWADGSGIINKPTAAVYPDFPGGQGTSILRPWLTSFIPYRVTGAYNPQELAMVTTAMRQIEIDSGYCIKFQQKPDSEKTGPFIDIRARRNPATPEVICITSHGYAMNANVDLGQPLVAYDSTNLAGGSNFIGACLDNQRDIMRLLMNTLGVRNAWQTQERRTHMVFPKNPSSLVAPELQSFGLYDETKLIPTDQYVNVGAIPFDSRSITMISPTRHAANYKEPIFRLADNLPPVPDEPRLSQNDCLTLRARGMYTCLAGFTPDCPDPFDLRGPRFYPSNKIIRTLQCQNHMVSSFIGELILMDVPYVATSPADQSITIEAVGTVLQQFGLKATLMRRSDVTLAAEAAPVRCPDNSLACYFSILIEHGLNRLPTIDGPRPGGVRNLGLSFNIKRGGMTFTTLTAMVTVNCAPVFTTISANVGPSNLLSSEVTYRFPKQIVALEPPTQQDNSALQPNTPLLLGQYLVNYRLPVAFGASGAKAAAGGATTTTVAKVFINCQADGTSIAGSTVVGRVTAMDPEGDPVKFYALSGDPRSGAAPTAPYAATGELHTVTEDGVISISGYADPVEIADGDGRAAFVGVGNVLANVDFSPTLARDVYIVAVDRYGASGILQARFYPACGFPVTA